MTKMKSKKMTKSTFAIIIMAIAMVAMLAFGGTYAYFTSVADATSGKAATTGTIKLAVNEISVTEKTNIVSGQKVLEEGVTVALDATTNVDTWVFAIFGVKLNVEGATQILADTDKDADSDLNETDCTAEGEYALVYTYNAAGGWVEVKEGNVVVAYAYHYDADGEVAADELPAVCSEIMFYGCTNYDADAPTGTGTLMGATITLTIESKAAQYEGLEDVNDAWAAVKALNPQA